MFGGPPEHVWSRDYMHS